MRTDFERKILRKMTNLCSYYNKEISGSGQLFQKTDIAKESVYFRTIQWKLTLKLIVIFNSTTDISFRKCVTKIFCISYYFQEKIGSVLRCSSQWLCLYIFSSTGANEMQVLYLETLGNIHRNFLHGIFLLKLQSLIVFPAISF